MENEWTREVSGGRIVRFTYLDLPKGMSFLTAQLAGHNVVYSVFLQQTERPFTREAVERQFEYECPRISN